MERGLFAQTIFEQDSKDRCKNRHSKKHLKVRLGSTYLDQFDDPKFSEATSILPEISDDVSKSSWITKRGRKIVYNLFR